jgi:hypothetical protein
MVRPAAELEKSVVAVPPEIFSRVDEAKSGAGLPASRKSRRGQHMNDLRQCVTHQEHIHSITIALPTLVLDGS